jgi:hypothetical protein
MEVGLVKGKNVPKSTCTIAKVNCIQWKCTTGNNMCAHVHMHANVYCNKV